MPALTGTQQLPQEKLAEDLDQVEEAMTGLQVLYEKYFLGIDRRPPDAQRRQVSETMRVLKTTTVKNTKRDAAIGAAAGAILGAATSRNKVKGGIIGAAAGGILGGVIGNNVDIKKKKTP